MQDSRWHQVELPGLAVADDRVAGVVAALEAHDRIGVLGEQVGDLSLAFIAPLGADDHDSGHRFSSVGSVAVRPIRATRANSGSVLGFPALIGAAVLADQRDFVAHLGQPRDRAFVDLLAQLLGVEHVRRDHHRALLLVACVDDRVELLEHPRRRLLGADVVDVEEVDGGELVEQFQVRAAVECAADDGQQPRQRVDRNGAPRLQGRLRDEHRERRLAGPDGAHEPQAAPVVEVVVDPLGEATRHRHDARVDVGDRRPIERDVAIALGIVADRLCALARAMICARHSHGKAVLVASSYSRPEPSQRPTGHSLMLRTSRGVRGA